MIHKGVDRTFSRGGGAQPKKYRKLAKRYRKIALFNLFRGEGGATEKKTKYSKKKLKNSTFKPLSTIIVPCIKIQGGTAPLLSADDAQADTI